MESRKHLAEAKKSAGTHNCTQSVLCTYYDYTPLDEETIKQAGNCFAVGMGNMEGTCGALVGAGIVYGLAVKDASCSRALAQARSCANVHSVWPMRRSFWRNCWKKQNSLRHSQSPALRQRQRAQV